VGNISLLQTDSLKKVVKGWFLWNTHQDNDWLSFFCVKVSISTCSWFIPNLGAKKLLLEHNLKQLVKNVTIVWQQCGMYIHMQRHRCTVANDYENCKNTRINLPTYSCM
jgi:uncharacterized protein with WD repeat